MRGQNHCTCVSEKMHARKIREPGDAKSGDVSRSLDRRHKSGLVGREGRIVESCGRGGTCKSVEAGVAFIPILAARCFL
jgi:hypothetical protein